MLQASRIGNPYVLFRHVVLICRFLGFAHQPALFDLSKPVSNRNQRALDLNGFALPAGLDLVWTSENYHDLHNKMFGPADMLLVDKAVFNALKPGGVFIVEDHAAEAGSGARDTDTLHRIDPALVRKEVLAAGFVLDGESTLLHNPNDPHTEAVFKLEGTSDKFLLKFRRPLK